VGRDLQDRFSRRNEFNFDRGRAVAKSFYERQPARQFSSRVRAVRLEFLIVFFARQFFPRASVDEFPFHKSRTSLRIPVPGMAQTNSRGLVPAALLPETKPWGAALFAGTSQEDRA
jgi:hypothetical protein